MGTIPSTQQSLERTVMNSRAMDEAFHPLAKNRHGWHGSFTIRLPVTDDMYLGERNQFSIDTVRWLEKIRMVPLDGIPGMP